MSLDYRGVITKEGARKRGPHYSWCRVVHGPEAGSRLAMLLWGLLELVNGEAPKPEGEERNKGFHWWMGGIQRKGAGEYLNLTLLPLSPFPQVPRGAGVPCEAAHPRFLG